MRGSGTAVGVRRIRAPYTLWVVGRCGTVHPKRIRVVGKCLGRIPHLDVRGSDTAGGVAEGWKDGGRRNGTSWGSVDWTPGDEGRKIRRKAEEFKIGVCVRRFRKRILYIFCSVCVDRIAKALI